VKNILRTVTLPAVTLPAAALAAAVVLSSCGAHDMGVTGVATSAPAGTAPTGGTPATGAKNAADVEFVTMMIPHHSQAIMMADLALKQASNPKILALAPKIKAAQGPENARMSGWLTGWGAQIPATAGGHEMSGMGGQEGSMMSEQEMTDLGAAKGSAFDRMWLQLMVRHHAGAVAQARTALTQGINPDGKQLAQSVIDSQSAQIAEMNSILTGIPA
jgi:uncharacterized protein (DUF305 family)